MEQGQSIVTPTGQIKFMAINHAIKNSYAEDRLEFVVRLEFNGDEAGAQALKKAITALNPAKVITNGVSKEGNFIVKFFSLHAPKVLDATGNVLTGEEIPLFYAQTDTGTARVQAIISTRGKTPTLYLKEIQLVSTNIVKREQEEHSSALQDLIQQEHGK